MGGGGGITTYLLNEARLANDLQFTLFNLREVKARENNVKIGGKKGIGLKFTKVGK